MTSEMVGMIIALVILVAFSAFFSATLSGSEEP